MDNIEKIYLSGDGASWINKSEYVLDRFHLSKYVKNAVAHVPHLTHSLWNYINRLEIEHVKDLFKVILELTETEQRKNQLKIQENIF